MAARRISALDVWMNGLRVGRWERKGHGQDQLLYSAQWMNAKEGRPLSLSLPFTQVYGTERVMPLRSEAVSTYFENLIPDNDRILQRLRDRCGARSTAAFDLLASIGRDCAGAVQLVPAGETPGDVRRFDFTALDDAGVARILRETTSSGIIGQNDQDAFRISIAGAQEKTGLLRHEGRWCIPHAATPSTHIFKLPLGVVGNLRIDMRDSVENEWLCIRILREFGLPVANADIGVFEDQKALIVERFDRRLSSDGAWWQRIPQEDFCQAFGLRSSYRYEADGGPGIARIMDVLQGSERAAHDRETFFKAQLLFWALAATDGHAKNFSIRLLRGGAYQLAPLYDVLSTYPVQGTGAGMLHRRDARLKLAMAVQGKNRHYALHEIHRWHWLAMAVRVGLQGDIEDWLESLIQETPGVLERVGAGLPKGFPQPLYDAVAEGLNKAMNQLAHEPDRRIAE
jgi:serine/threonine-protein kinase HipA